MPDAADLVRDISSYWERLRATASDAWAGLVQTPLSEKIAIGTLAAAVIIAWPVAAWRILSRISPRKKKPVDDEKKTWAKRIGLALAVILPGGLVGTAAVALVMGKENWRRDSLWIVAASLIPGAPLAWVCSGRFPYPMFGDNAILRCVLTVSFAVLHLWTLIKLLREALGETPEKVPWWPPIALWLQTAILVTAIMLVSQ